MGVPNAERQRKIRTKERDASPSQRQEYLLEEKQKYKEFLKWCNQPRIQLCVNFLDLIKIR